jgi:[protein-PII] uridylyltransferase
MLTGVLLAHGMNILTARINTSRSGLALDIFRLSHGEQPEVAQRPERWERLVVTLGQVLTEHLDVEQLVAREQRETVLTKKYVPRVGTEVEIDNEVSEHFTVLDVYTQDRVGVLFAITNTLFHLGVDIHIAKITTNVDQVLDVFYVTDAAGQKIVDKGRLAHIEAELMQRLTDGRTQAAAG